MYGLTGEPLQTLYKIVAIFILLGVQLMATARARVRYVTVHMMAPNGPIIQQSPAIDPVCTLRVLSTRKKSLSQKGFLRYCTVRTIVLAVPR